MEYERLERGNKIDLFAEIMWIWFHGMGIIFTAITLYILWSTIKIFKE